MLVRAAVAPLLGEKRGERGLHRNFQHSLPSAGAERADSASPPGEREGDGHGALATAIARLKKLQLFCFTVMFLEIDLN